jgi:hypothetical protein
MSAFHTHNHTANPIPDLVIDLGFVRLIRTIARVVFSDRAAAESDDRSRDAEGDP